MANVGPDAPPAFRARAFTCPCCDAYAEQTWYEFTHRRPSEPVTGTVYPSTTAHERVKGEKTYTNFTWFHTVCQHCGEWTVWRQDDLIYPLLGSAPPPAKDMPEPVKALYEEARRVNAVSRRAGAGMARVVLEFLLKTVLPEFVTVPPKAQLDDLTVLAEKEVSSGLARRLTLVRHAGNKSLHVENKPDDVMVLVLDEETTAMVNVLFTTINDCVDELVTRRQENDTLTDLVPQDVLDAIERKRVRQAERDAASS